MLYLKKLREEKVIKELSISEKTNTLKDKSADESFSQQSFEKFLSYQFDFNTHFNINDFLISQDAIANKLFYIPNLLTQTDEDILYKGLLSSEWTIQYLLLLLCLLYNIHR